MGNTVTYGPGVINIVTDGATDYDSTSAFPHGLRICEVIFYPSAANDVLKVRHGTATGTIISVLKTITGDVLKDYVTTGVPWKPYITATDLTLGTPANAVIILRYY